MCIYKIKNKFKIFYKLIWKTSAPQYHRPFDFRANCTNTSCDWLVTLKSTTVITGTPLPRFCHLYPFSLPTHSILCLFSFLSFCYLHCKYVFFPLNSLVTVDFSPFKLIFLYILKFQYHWILFWQILSLPLFINLTTIGFQSLDKLVSFCKFASVWFCLLLITLCCI